MHTNRPQWLLDLQGMLKGLISLDISAMTVHDFDRALPHNPAPHSLLPMQTGDSCT
jgi:hypothetical protein